MRFPGFTDDWKKTTLGEISSSISSGKSGNPVEDGEYELYGSMGVIGRTHKGDYDGEKILIARVGANAGKINYNSYRCGITDNTLIVQLKDISVKFIYYYLIHSNLNRLVFGSGQPLITGGMLKKLKINLPSDVESERIAKLLEYIDERIATQNKIIEDLKKLKSAIYDKVFQSLKGERLSLGDIADIIKGQQVNGEFLTEVGDYYVMNGGVGPSGYYHDFNTSANTISLSEGGNSCGYVQWNSNPFWSGGHCYTLDIIDSSIDNKYLYHFLKWRETDIMKLRIGSGLPNIQKKVLSKVPVLIPMYSLQTKIAHSLDAYDIKIKNDMSVLELYKRQKLFLLSQMFI